MKYTPEQIEQAKNTTFYCDELGETLTIGQWWKELMLHLNSEEESFSGKRPFGNSSWKCDPEKALIKAGLLQGEIDEDDDLLDCEDSTALFNEIIRSMK
jgi:hypothetical protein